MASLFNELSNGFNRRRFLQGSAAVAGLGLNIHAFGETTSATVKTVEGTLEGLRTNGVLQFRGVRYAEPQTLENRFRPPLPLKPWTGTRQATKDGHPSLQIFTERPAFGGPFVTGLSNTSTASEDCLFVNVFTPSLTGKRPVMFWLHGGGYASGSGGNPLYDGTNLATFGDVVVVNVNHRLNIFGYGIASETTPFTANAGMLDLVEALKWVKRNIANFGGDPGNVTIFGQSGGGSKVCTLMVMPSAKGLFKRAIVESGSALKLRDKSDVVEATEKVAKQLGVSREQLATLPADQVLQTMGPIAANGFSSVVDGSTISRNPFDPDAPAEAHDIPMLIGTVRTEASYTTDNSLFTLDEQSMEARVKGLVGASAPALIAEYKQSHPGATPSLIYFLIASDAGARRNATIQAERKWAQHGAPVYLYHFEWKTPVNDIWYSPHAIELPFVFRNLDIAKPSIGAGPVQTKLADQVSSAWIAFARTGNPSNEVTGAWAPYEPQKRPTMVFNTDTKMVDDPNQKDRVAIFKELGTEPLRRNPLASAPPPAKKG